MLKLRDSFRIIRENWDTVLMIAAADFGFVMLILGLKAIGVVQMIYRGPVFTYRELLSAVILASVLLSFLILASSFHTFIVLGLIQRLSGKRTMRFARFSGFLKTSIIVSLQIVGVMLLFFASTSYYIKKIALEGGNPSTILPMAVIITLAGLAILIHSYVLMNILQNLSVSRKVTGLIRKAYAGSFKLESYGVFSADIRLLLISGVVGLILHVLIRTSVLSGIRVYMEYYAVYRLALVSALAIICYFLLLHNRLYYYQSYNRHAQ